jgi:hypothetical protein
MTKQNRILLAISAILASCTSTIDAAPKIGLEFQTLAAAGSGSSAADDSDSVCSASPTIDPRRSLEVTDVAILSSVDANGNLELPRIGGQV